MPVQAIVSLNTLRCLAESDLGGTSHSEPYVWPFLFGVAQSPGTWSTTPEFATVTESRKVIRNEMRAGDTANLDFPGNRLAITFESDQTAHQMILIVALLEWDSTPQAAITAGYQAFLDALKGQSRVFLTLNAADEEDTRRKFAEIKKEVQAKVTKAIKAKLSLGSKLFDNQDDFLAVDFVHFGSLAAAPFTLHFAGKSGDLKGFVQDPAPVEFTLEGDLSVAPVLVDLCQAEVDALNAVEARLRSLQEQVQSLQARLSTATPQQRPSIIAEIQQINAQQIPPAKAALLPAQRKLGICRAQEQSRGPIGQPGGAPALG